MTSVKRGSLIALGAATGAGLVGAGVTAAVVGHRALTQRGPREELSLPGIPPGVERRTVTMSDGARLTVLDTGPGDPDRLPFVLLHGITLAAAIWHHELASLAAAGHRVVAYDFRGHGTSDATDLTFDRLVADLGEVLDQLDLPRVVLVGHSMGGMVAIKAVADDAVTASGGGRVAALGLVATSASPVTGSGLPGARVVARGLQPLLSRGAWLTRRLPGPSLPKSDVAYVISRLNFGEAPDPAEVALTQQVVTDVLAATTGALLFEILRFDDTAALRDVHLPATVVVGTRDVATPVRHGEALAEAIGGAQLLVLDGCGHMVMLERPAELDAALLGLARRAAGADPTPADASTSGARAGDTPASDAPATDAPASDASAAAAG